MQLTNEEFAAVAAYETPLRTAIRSNYLRNVGRSGLAVLVPIYARVTGYSIRVNPNCGPCILDFLKRLGAIYFTDQAEREQQAAEPTPEPMAPAATPRRRRTKSESESVE